LTLQPWNERLAFSSHLAQHSANPMNIRQILGWLMVGLWAMAGGAATPQAKLLPGDGPLADYFQAQTAQLSGHVLGGVQSLDQWTSCRKKKREDLFEMLGLSPLPQATDLKPVVTGKLETELFTVEKLHFQSSPGLYVTANLYIP